MSLTISLSVQPCAFKYFNSLASSSLDIKLSISFTCLFLCFPLAGYRLLRLAHRPPKKMIMRGGRRRLHPLVCGATQRRVNVKTKAKKFQGISYCIMLESFLPTFDSRRGGCVNNLYRITEGQATKGEKENESKVTPL